ncbi:MAG: 3-hydroxyacyl-CoA dehydrogenase [Candidatus Nezhaarchaeota archaeon]|nr:3-hydroxyacyl-CoA dehydrogenase [Candidatus Nezhaarchaeota archaeon]MCX8142261.1 3-hydroxyacyl-CoA dehydrogenase [Candidatus Nezhaarchaeota archaeon]MDW8050766.1 3-hydroxyacyl-CoA dehydrogenase [Nitrososphaerota archaeon]
MAERLKKAAVIGAGIMGHGIAQILAMTGIEVAMVDISDDLLKKAMERIRWSLGKFVEKRRIRQEDADATIARIKPTTSYEEAAKDIDLAVEAIPENLDLKKKIFTKLDSIAPPHAILTSNTSTLSITEIGNATKRPDKVAGLHFFNPPQMMILVEVIKGEKTSQDTINTLVELVKKLGKTPIVVKKDVRGFVVNRVLGTVFVEAFWALNRGEATKEGIDASIKYEGGFPMGWFELADFVGLDVVYETGKVMYEAYGERMKPCPEVIEPLIRAGKLGQKSGAGFYDWSKGRPRIPFSLAGEYDVERSWAVAVNEAAWLVYEDVATPADIDTGMKLGTGWPSGPCEYADRKGIDVMLNKLRELYNKYKMELYKPCPLLEQYVSKGWLGKKTGKGFYTY